MIIRYEGNSTITTADVVTLSVTDHLFDGVEITADSVTNRVIVIVKTKRD